MKKQIQIAQELLKPLSGLYRKCDTKPGAIAVTKDQFDALCDVVADHAAFIEAPSKLIEELRREKPETFPNYTGADIPARYPIGTLLARCGEVFMFYSLKPKRFTVVYALEMTCDLNREQAAEKFGQCCLHQSQCYGLLAHDA